MTAMRPEPPKGDSDAVQLARALLARLVGDITEVSKESHWVGLSQPADPASAPTEAEAPPLSSSAMVSAHSALVSYARLRRLRDVLFPGGWFADPAWEILLDLYIAKGEGRKVSVSSACIASGVPPTTALRWIKQLERGGMIRRVSDSAHRRRVWVQLCGNAEDALTRWVAMAFPAET